MSYSLSWNPSEKCGTINKISKYEYHVNKSGNFANVTITEEIINIDATPTQEKTINLFNQLAKKYCNKKYAYNGECSNNTIWAMNTNDVFAITGKELYINNENDYSCIADKTCIDTLDIINTSTDYWIATALKNNVEDKNNNAYMTNGLHNWSANDQFFTLQRNYCWGGKNLCQKFLRPIVKLNPQIYVLSGNGTEATPYTIAID